MCAMYSINNVSHVINIKLEVIATLNASYLLHQVIFQHNPQSSLCIWPPCRVFQNPVTAEIWFCPSQPFTKSQIHVPIIAELRQLPNICFSSTKLVVAPMLLSYLFLIWWVRAPPNKAMRWRITHNGTVTPSHVQWPRHPVHQFFVCHQPLYCVSVLFVCVPCRGLWAAWADVKVLWHVRWAFDDDHHHHEDHDHSICVDVLHGCCMPLWLKHVFC